MFSLSNILYTILDGDSEICKIRAENLSTGDVVEVEHPTMFMAQMKARELLLEKSKNKENELKQGDDIKQLSSSEEDGRDGAE